MKKEVLAILEKLSDAGELDIYSGDEPGVNLEPNVHPMVGSFQMKRLTKGGSTAILMGGGKIGE